MYLKNFLIFLCLLNARKALAYFCELQNEDRDLCAESNNQNECVKLGEKYYLIYANEEVNWYIAERSCRRKNGYLAAVENDHEMDLISDYLVSKNYLEKLFWIAYNDLGTEGTFYSMKTGDVMNFKRWSEGEPNNASDNENCVHIWKFPGGYLMNDLTCERQINYICELKQKETCTGGYRWH